MFGICVTVQSLIEESTDPEVSHGILLIGNKIMKLQRNSSDVEFSLVLQVITSYNSLTFFWDGCLSP